MGGKVPNYQIVYRGETLNYFKLGGYVFFQRLKEYGGGYWLGKTHEDGFEFVLEQPTSLNEGIRYLLVLKCIEDGHLEFVDDIDNFNLQ
ncbi:hypothetical protein E0S44_14720 [Salmonella enterica subsp. enterica serovar Orion]|nr:hypothetical protein [Salmonella enterica subsp. enterica serovar Orion]